MERRAVYHQKSDVVHEEFGLIETAMQREVQVDQLFKIISAVKEQRRELDNACILETFRLFNKVRQTTIDLIKTVSKWQQSFTLPIRPHLFDCDYIIDRVVNHIDFINSTKVTKMFNFHFYRGNALLLPFANQKVHPPVRISKKLAAELRIFSAPDEEDIIFCYQFFLNSLPEKVYKNNLSSLSNWMTACWLPRVWVSDAQDEIEKQNTNIMKSYARDTMKADKGAGKRSTRRLVQQRNRLKSQVAAPSEDVPVKRSHAQSSVLGAVSGSSRRSSAVASTSLQSRRDSAASMIRRSSSGRVGSPTDAPTKMKRRNQLTKNGVRNVMKLTDGVRGGGTSQSDSSARRRSMRRRSSVRRRRSMSSRRSDGSAQSEPEEEEDTDPDAGLTEEEKAQKQRAEKKKAELEQYYAEMENMFIPKVGRRAVQTVAVGGAIRDIDEMQKELEELHKPDRVFFLHTTKAEMQMRDRIIYGGKSAEQFKRTNATLIAKKNRIVADGRGVELRAVVGHQKPSEVVADESVGEPVIADDGKADDRSVPSVHSAKSTASTQSHDSSTNSHSVRRRAIVQSKGRRNSRMSDVTFSPAPSRKNTLTSAPSESIVGAASSWNRRNSRRMSDLTVTFSVADGDSERPHSVEDLPQNKNPFRQKARDNSKKSPQLAPLPRKDSSHSPSMGSVTQVLLAAQKFRSTSGKSSVSFVDEDSATYSSASYSSNEGSDHDSASASASKEKKQRRRSKKTPKKLPTVELNLTTSTMRQWYAAEQNIDLVSI